MMRYSEACRVLGVSAGSHAPEIKKAYRKLARQYHPDSTSDPHAQQMWLEVQQAYELLTSTPPLTHAEPVEYAPPSWPGDRLPFIAPRLGMDVTGNLRVTLQEIFEGTITDITFDDEQGCERCGATGAEPSSGWMPCPPCQTMPDTNCPWCAGESRVPEEVCRVCRGAGVERLPRTVRVAVPRSAEDGQVLRVREKGRWGVQGRGDLRLTLRVEEPTYMRRQGDDLEVDVSVGVLQAVLGGTAHVPSLDNRQYTIAVTPGSSSGKRYRIRGHGMYRHKSGDDRGDLYAVIAIHVPDPRTLSERETYLYQLLLEEEAKKSAAGELGSGDLG